MNIADIFVYLLQHGKCTVALENTWSCKYRMALQKKANTEMLQVTQDTMEMSYKTTEV